MEKIHKIWAPSLKYDLVCVKIVSQHLWKIFDAPPSQKVASLGQKNGKCFFFKMKPQLHDIVSHANIHNCAKFGSNITNHALGMVESSSFALKPIDFHASWTSL